LYFFYFFIVLCNLLLNYVSANNVVQLKDEESGQIICSGMAKDFFELRIERFFRYTLIIDIKDGKIRTSFENIQSETVGKTLGPDMNTSWPKVEKNLLEPSSNLMNAINSGPVKDNW